MKKIFFLFFVNLVMLSSAQEKPRLVVGIVVDQMRQDYLLRFYDKFSNNGFKRLLNEGFQFKNAHYNYVPTYTAPGHASIYTGTTPAHHGIIGNSWYDRKNEKSVYCVSDPSVSNVGGSLRNGRMSPKNLIASTITDELLMTTNFRSKVIGISIKDRGSILPAGHNPTGAYWMDSKSGDFMTSTYYTNELPSWMVALNNQKLPSKYLNQTWETLLPIDQYVESSADDAPYERQVKGKEKTTFPYDLKELVKSNGVGLVRSTPFGNSIVLDVAMAAIDGEKLGEDAITDFLAISFSSTDYVGHHFGPNSIELEDTYIRLDRELERLFEKLDAELKGEYLIFLSSDHGVVNVPLYLKDQKMPGGYLDQKEMVAPFQEKVAAALGEGEWIEDISNDQIFLNHQLIEEKKVDFDRVRQTIKRITLRFSEVADVYTYDELVQRNATDPFKRRIENGFNSKRSGDLAVRLKSGYINGSYGKQGTTHGSGYIYDTHIPMIFYGKGIKQGSSIRQVSITDIAPSISMLLGISLPSAATGQPLKELFE